LFDDDTSGDIWVIRFVIVVFLHSMLTIVLSTGDVLMLPNIIVYYVTVDFLSGMLFIAFPLFVMNQLRKRIQKIEKIPSYVRIAIRIGIPGILFSWFSYSILFQISIVIFYDINLSSFVFFVSTFIVYSALVIFLKPSHSRQISENFEKIIHARIVRILFWVPTGVVSGLLIGLGFVLSWNRLGYPEILSQQSQVVLWASMITLGVLTLISVMNAEQRASVYHPQIQNYVSLLAKLGRTNSEFLESYSTKNPPTLPSYNAALARERIENMIPWTLFIVSLNALMIPPYIFDLISSSDAPDLNVTVMIVILLLSAVYSFVTMTRNYLWHVKWKNMWTDLWEIVRLFSLDIQSLGVEYSFTMSEGSWPIEFHDMKETEKKERIKKLLSDWSLKDTIPSDSIILDRLFINAVNYFIVQRLLNNPDKRMQEFEDTFSFMKKARKLLNNIRVLELSISAGPIVTAFLLIKLPKMKTIPKEMLQDIRPLWEENHVGTDVIRIAAEEYVEDLMESEKSVIPSSLRRFATIYPIAMSISAIAVLILQSII